MAKKKGTRRESLNRRRKGRLAVILPWLRRFGMGLLAGVFLVWLAAWLWMSGAIARAGAVVENAAIELAADNGFRVDNIMLEGRVHSDGEALKALINVNRGDPIFAFDPAEAKALIERMAWVKHAHVERRLPDTIYIRLEEKQPLALWQANKALSLIDAEGKVIVAGNLSRFKKLIVVMGDGAPENARDLLLNLQAEPLIMEKTRSARYMDGRRWDLILDNDVGIKLPEQDVGLALRRLAFAQEQDGLLERDIVGVDLREPERIVVRTRPGAVQEYKADTKTGSNI